MVSGVLDAIHSFSQWLGDILAALIAAALMMAAFALLAGALFLAAWAFAWVLAKLLLWADGRGVFDWIARHARPFTTERSRRNWRLYLSDLLHTAEQLTGK